MVVNCTGLPHRLTEDDVYEGMFIPKGSLVGPPCLWNATLLNNHFIMSRVSGIWEYMVRRVTYFLCRANGYTDSRIFLLFEGQFCETKNSIQTRMSLTQSGSFILRTYRLRVTLIP